MQPMTSGKQLKGPQQNLISFVVPSVQANAQVAEMQRANRKFMLPQLNLNTSAVRPDLQGAASSTTA